MESPLNERFRIIHFETGSRGRESPAKNERLDKKIWRIVKSPFALGIHLHGERPDLIHINTAISHKPFWRDSFYLLICKLFRRKVILQTHGGSLRYLTALPGMRKLVKGIYTRADAVVLLAKSEKQDFNELGIAENLYIIPNAIDTRLYFRSKEQMHNGIVRRLAFISRLIRPKGMFEAMEALRILRSEGDYWQLKLKIAGSGPAEDEIEKWIKSNKMNDCIELVGPLYGSAKIDFLHNADLLLFPTFHPEGLPYVIIESLAAGTPVITSRVAGIPDIVVDGEHGKLVDPQDPMQIVEAVRELSRSSEGLKLMSRKCSDLAASQLGLERLASDFGKLYERLLN